MNIVIYIVCVRGKGENEFFPVLPPNGGLECAPRNAQLSRPVNTTITSHVIGTTRAFMLADLPLRLTQILLLLLLILTIRIFLCSHVFAPKQEKAKLGLKN